MGGKSPASASRTSFSIS
uniref:Uncharacterized protein n=1 Tax=Arundo donax TaxID=35708 RepID=A0A0A8YGV6_ARUDO